METSCLYGVKCYKKDCHYAHPEGRNISNDQIKSTKYCRFGNDCNSSNCPFAHPKDQSPEPPKENYNFPKMCKFGNNCKRENCKFSHLKDQEVNEPRKITDPKFIKDNNFAIECDFLHPPPRPLRKCRKNCIRF